MTTTKQKLVVASFASTKLQPETLEAIGKVDAGCVSAQSIRIGLASGEPLLLSMDGLLRYAKAYQKRFEGDKLADDGFLGQPWLDAAKGIRALLNGDGAVAYERGITTDSKDNGVIEEIFWAAMNAAGFTEADL